MSQHFDAVVIGTGQSGPSLAVKLAGRASAQPSSKGTCLRGTCVNVGCTPTKTYVASARAAHVARRAADFWRDRGGVRVDMTRVKARKDEVIAGSRDGVEKWLRDTPGVSVFTGHGRFTGPHSVSVAGSDGEQQDLDADAIFINTGTRATVPHVDGIESITYHTNSTILDITELPAHLVIVGGSYVALEFAQIFRRFGSRVTVLVRGEWILGREDADFALQIQKVLSREGVEFVFDANATRLEPSGDGVRIVLKDRGIEASHLLFATGRTPNTDDLGLDRAGLVPDKHGIIAVDGQLRTSVPGIGPRAT